MAVIARAMDITRLKIELTDAETDKLLAGFKDANTASEYARNSIAKCVKAGLVTGREGKLVAPKDNITRAETAVIIRKLLQQSDLI